MVHVRACRTLTGFCFCPLRRMGLRGSGACCQGFRMRSSCSSRSCRRRSRALLAWGSTRSSQPLVRHATTTHAADADAHADGGLRCTRSWAFTKIPCRPQTCMQHMCVLHRAVCSVGVRGTWPICTAACKRPLKRHFPGASALGCVACMTVLVRPTRGWLVKHARLFRSRRRNSGGRIQPAGERHHRTFESSSSLRRRSSSSNFLVGAQSITACACNTMHRSHDQAVQGHARFRLTSGASHSPLAASESAHPGLLAVAHQPLCVIKRDTPSLHTGEWPLLSSP